MQPSVPSLYDMSRAQLGIGHLEFAITTTQSVRNREILLDAQLNVCGVIQQVLVPPSGLTQQWREQRIAAQSKLGTAAEMEYVESEICWMRRRCCWVETHISDEYMNDGSYQNGAPRRKGGAHRNTTKQAAGHR
jgi:hypothetical protein